MQLTTREQQLILAALVTVTPNGGGSENNTLAHKLMNEWQCWANDTTVAWMVNVNTKNVLDDAQDAGVIDGHRATVG